MNNVLIRAEVVSLDSTVANNISSHILSGNSLKIYFRNVSHYYSNI